jgi:hypothetical protein
MGNSSYTVQNLVDIARAMGDLAPTLPTGGAYETVALSATNDAMTALLAGSSKGSPFNFKFNRINIPTFFINSYQQDYASAVVNLGWLESCGAYNTSSTMNPKPFRVIEVKRDVLITTAQQGGLAKIQWMDNENLQFGSWGVTQVLSLTGLANPGPGVVYTNPAGLTAMPVNPTTQVKDAFGNLWIVTTYGTCGGTNPFLSNLNPVYPSLSSPSTVATTAADGGVVWTAVNPKGQGFRLNPMPTQSGPVWQIAPIGQARIAQFTALGQLLDPVPDDFFSYFKTGFFCQCYRFHPDPKQRAKFDQEFRLWMQSLDNAVRQGSREDDDWGFYPSSNVMDTGWAWNPVTPAMPYGPWSV